MTTIYNYSDINGEYLNESVARSDPMDEGKFLIPANSTEEAPPPTDVNQIARRITDGWEVVPDWRGAEYWLADGSHHTIDEINIDIPTDALASEPPTPIEDYKDQATDRVDSKAGFVRNSFVSVGNLINEEYRLAEQDARAHKAVGYPDASVPLTVQAWADAQEITQQVATDQIVTKADAMYQAIAAIRAARLAGKAAIKNATNHATVDTAEASAIDALEAINPTVTGS